MPSLTVLRRVGPLLVAGLLLAGCAAGAAPSSAPPPRAGGSLEQQSVQRDGVDVVVSGTLDRSEATFDVDLTRHEGDLTNDLSASTAVVGGTPLLAAPTWEGEPPTGHHRSGRLSFGGLEGRTGAVALTLSGWGQPLVLRWSAQGARQSTP